MMDLQPEDVAHVAHVKVEEDAMAAVADTVAISLAVADTAIVPTVASVQVNAPHATLEVPAEVEAVASESAAVALPRAAAVHATALN
jgi:hypothetical protein